MQLGPVQSPNPLSSVCAGLYQRRRCWTWSLSSWGRGARCASSALAGRYWMGHGSGSGGAWTAPFWSWTGKTTHAAVPLDGWQSQWGAPPWRANGRAPPWAFWGGGAGKGNRIAWVGGNGDCWGSPKGKPWGGGKGDAWDGAWSGGQGDAWDGGKGAHWGGKWDGSDVWDGSDAWDSSCWGARGAAARTMHPRSLEVKPSARKPMAPPGQPLAPRKGPGQLERQFCPKCFIIAECHAVGNGRKRCVSCSKTYKAGAVPSRVPACPLCGGYSVIFNGSCFMCTPCNKAFRPPRGNALKAYRTRAAVGA